jgi:hypothetical protein
MPVRPALREIAMTDITQLLGKDADSLCSTVV